MKASFFLLISIGHFAVCTGKLKMLKNGSFAVPCSLSAYDADKDGRVTLTEIENFFLEETTEEKAKIWSDTFFRQFDFNKLPEFDEKDNNHKKDNSIQVEELYLDKTYQKDCILAVLMRGMKGTRG